jgi:hypothetical protein
MTSARERKQQGLTDAIWGIVGGLNRFAPGKFPKGNLMGPPATSSSGIKHREKQQVTKVFF